MNNLINLIRGEERSGGEKNSADFNMKSSSSEESVRKRSHSVGGNSLAPSTLSTMTTTNICEISDAVIDIKQEIIGKAQTFGNVRVLCDGLALCNIRMNPISLLSCKS